MDGDEVYASILRALRRANSERARTEADLRDLRARFDHLLSVLAGTGVLNGGHIRLIDRVGVAAGQDASPRVRLQLLVDKHQVPSPEIDCAERLPLCRARCCAIEFPLSTQDLDDGVRWQVDQPYLILQNERGMCSHFDRDQGACTIYDKRPAPCRAFDCRNDPDIWIDFDKRIPAP